MARTAGRVGLPHLSMVVAGLATFVLVASVLQDRSDTVEVWVAADDLAPGAALDARHLTAVEVAADDPLTGVLLPVAGGAPAGRVRHVVAAGEPVLASDLVAVDDVAAERTFAIPIDRSVVDGLGLALGDRVDVIGAVDPGPGGDSAESSSERIGYVVVDVEVVRLPAGESAGAFAAAGSRETWITVSVDHEQALRLSASLDAGEVDLVRSTGAVSIEVGS